MEKLTSLVYNFNTDCYKQYTEVSSLLGGVLDDSLKEIERFYYSEFWEDRFKRRLKEEGIPYNPIELDIIQGTISSLKEDTQFKMFEDDSSQNGVSNKHTMIALNVNLSKDKLNDSHINSIIMHEFGHRQYNQKEFELIIDLNKRIMGVPGLFIKNNEVLSQDDYPYFTDDNELRQRIIPIIKEMVDNKWTPEEVYENSNNLKDIKSIFTEKYLIKLIDNLL